MDENGFICEVKRNFIFFFLRRKIDRGGERCLIFGRKWSRPYLHIPTVPRYTSPVHSIFLGATFFCVVFGSLQRK